MRRRFIIGGIILFFAMGFLIFTVIDDSLSYYVTVSELLEEGSDRYGESVRVSGTVVEGSIEWTPEDNELKFDIAEEDATLPIVYKGDVPHTLTAGKGLVVKGKYNQDGIFHATKLTMKCASKYEAED